MTQAGNDSAAFPLVGRPGEQMGHDVPDCVSCAEVVPTGECRASQRPCGHHCDHSWSHEHCCWCGKEWEEDDE